MTIPPIPENVEPPYVEPPPSPPAWQMPDPICPCGQPELASPCIAATCAHAQVAQAADWVVCPDCNHMVMYADRPLMQPESETESFTRPHPEQLPA